MTINHILVVSVLGGQQVRLILLLNCRVVSNYLTLFFKGFFRQIVDVTLLQLYFTTQLISLFLHFILIYINYIYPLYINQTFENLLYSILFSHYISTTSIKSCFSVLINQSYILKSYLKLR
jgi:uncharacterized membrane protein YagU involved in acid resistance